MDQVPVNPERNRIPYPDSDRAVDRRDFGVEAGESSRPDHAPEIAREIAERAREIKSGEAPVISREAAQITQEMLQSDKTLNEQQLKHLVTETLQGNLDPSNPAEVMEALNAYQKHKMEHPEYPN